MTLEEKQEKIDSTIAQCRFPSWVFDELTCTVNAPIPCPNDGKHYRWDESIVNWVEVTLPEGA
jgi:hypothetical protein